MKISSLGRTIPRPSSTFIDLVQQQPLAPVNLSSSVSVALALQQVLSACGPFSPFKPDAPTLFDANYLRVQTAAFPLLAKFRAEKNTRMAAALEKPCSMVNRAIIHNYISDLQRAATTMPVRPPVTTVRPDAPLPVQTADKFPPNPNVPFSQWSQKPSDAFLIEHHVVANVRDWFRNALRELRSSQVEELVVALQKADFSKMSRAPEVYLKYKDVILEYAAKIGLPVPELSSTAVATPVTAPEAQTKVEDVGRSLIPVGTVEQFKQANPMQQVATGQSASTAAPTAGTSMNMKLGIAAVAALGVGYFWWQSRKP